MSPRGRRGAAGKDSSGEQELASEAVSTYRVHQELAACRRQLLEEGQRSSQYAEKLRAKLESAERSRLHYQTLAEQRLGEVLWLRCEMSTSWRGLMQKEMAAAVERTGVAAPLPAGLFPGLAAEVARVSDAAMERRAARLAGDGRGLAAFHPDVDMYGSMSKGGLVDYKPTLARLASLTDV